MKCGGYGLRFKVVTHTQEPVKHLGRLTQVSERRLQAFVNGVSHRAYEVVEAQSSLSLGNAYPICKTVGQPLLEEAQFLDESETLDVQKPSYGRTDNFHGPSYGNIDHINTRNQHHLLYCKIDMGSEEVILADLPSF